MPFEYDQVNIVCPVYAPGTHESDAEKYIIYNVSVPVYLDATFSIANCTVGNRVRNLTFTFCFFTVSELRGANGHITIPAATSFIDKSTNYNKKYTD